MFKTFMSMFCLNMKLEPEAGFLIASGAFPVDPSEPDIQFIKMKHASFSREFPFIPGSSIKGPMRSHAEALLRSKKKCVCNILSRENNCFSNYSKKDDEDTGIERYKASCTACRTFGGRKLASKVRIDDFLPYESEEELNQAFDRIEKALTVRNGVAIDRKTGKAEGKALFFHHSYSIPFYGTITLKNPEKWQLALLFILVDHINAGLIKFGHSKSRGLGKLNAEIRSIDIFSPDDKIHFQVFDGNGFAQADFQFDVRFDGEIVKKATINSKDKLKEFKDKVITEGVKELETLQ